MIKSNFEIILLVCLCCSFQVPKSSYLLIQYLYFWDLRLYWSMSFKVGYQKYKHVMCNIITSCWLILSRLVLFKIAQGWSTIRTTRGWSSHASNRTGGANNKDMHNKNQKRSHWLLLLRQINSTVCTITTRTIRTFLHNKNAHMKNWAIIL